jgi:cobalt-zinc-cadmium efflux system outer membrane protein
VESGSAPPGELRPVAYQPDRQAPKDKIEPTRGRPTIPPELPGADSPDLTDLKTREQMKKAFPPIPPLPPEPPLAQGPEGRPLSLADLQHMGETYSPAIKNARAAVEAARGAAKQAGMYPNPSIFFEQDTTQTFQAGYQGLGVDQVIKTGGKLKFQQAAAIMDLLNAKLALRRAQSELRYSIRGSYFALLVARENIKISAALLRFTDEVYQLQMRKATGEVAGFAAVYEPMQLRPLALQARLNLLAARNQYQASWKQLAAAIGLPHLPPTELEGGVDLPIPAFTYQELEARLVDHTDFLTALNNLQKARYTLELAKLTPVPDVDVHVLIQKDYTTPPFQVVHSLAVTVPVPIWDQNKGGIYQAQAQLAQASVGPDQARNTLINTLADAWNRYQTAAASVEIALQQTRDQIRVYRRVYAAHDVNPNDVGFGDIVTAQQTLATYITSYATALGLQWQAVVDVANLLQTDDLFNLHRQHPVMPIPDLQRLLPTDPPSAWDGPSKPGEVSDHPQAPPIQAGQPGSDQHGPPASPVQLPAPLPLPRREGAVKGD